MRVGRDAAGWSRRRGGERRRGYFLRGRGEETEEWAAWWVWAMTRSLEQRSRDQTASKVADERQQSGQAG
jgi:hypothetical protein